MFNTKCQGASQEIGGSMSPTYIMSAFLHVHRFGSFAIQFQFKPCSFCFLKSPLFYGLHCLRLFSVFKLYFFFLHILFFFVLIPSAVTHFVSPTWEPFRHSFIFNFQHSDRCPKQTLFLDLPSQKSQSWWLVCDTRKQSSGYPQAPKLSPKMKNIRNEEM